jgi:hypothetical protein
MEKEMANNVYQLNINLKHMEPPVWRRIKVPGKISFHVLHRVIQILFDWEDAHMYEFRQANIVIAEKDDFDEKDKSLYASWPKNNGQNPINPAKLRHRGGAIKRKKESVSQLQIWE